MNMKEEVKRLKPSEPDLRKLFVYSGNQCAYPGCDVSIVDTEGNYIGRVCHIEAAAKLGPRFNERMTNEDRRDFDNLILLCANHHIVTDDVAKYNVSVLKEMKANHEMKFRNIIKDMSTSFLSDVTKEQEIIYPKNLDSMNLVLGWGHNREDLNGSLEFTKQILTKLLKLTPKTRSVFAVMLDRSDGELIPLDEIRHVLNIDQEKFNEYIAFLSRSKFISDPEIRFFSNEYTSNIESYNGWEFWIQFKEYCQKEDIDLVNVIKEMRFDVLDDPNLIKGIAVSGKKNVRVEKRKSRYQNLIGGLSDSDR